MKKTGTVRPKQRESGGPRLFPVPPPGSDTGSSQPSIDEITELRTRLPEAEETLRATRSGEVEAPVAEGPTGPHVFSPAGADAESNRVRGDMLAQVSDAVIAVDNDQHITFINAAAETYYRITAADVLGRKLSEIYMNHWPNTEAETVAETSLRERGSWRGETLQRRWDGRERHVESTVTILRDSRGEASGIITAVRDISERKRVDALLDARARQQQVLARLGLDAVHEIDPQKLFDHAVAAIAHALDVEMCKVLELLPGGRDLLLRAGVGWREGLVGYATVDIGPESQAGYTLATREPVIVDDLRIESRFNGPPLLREHGVVSGLSCIIAGSEGRAWGVLGGHTASRRGFTTDDVAFLQGVANILAAFIQRKQADQAVRRSEAELRDFIENATVGLHWVGPDGIIIWANQTELDLLGFAREEYVGHHIAEFHAEADVINGILTRLTAGEALYECPARLRCKDGSFREVLINSNVLFENGKFVHTRCFTRDVTERKRNEEALRESEEFTRRILDNLFGFVGVMTTDGILVQANRAPLEAAAITPGEVLGKKLWDTYWWNYSPEIQAQVRDWCERAAGGELIRSDVLVRMAEDTRLWIDFQLAPLRDAEGRITHLIPSAMNISGRVAAETALRQSEEFNRTVLESSPDCIKVLDGEGRLQFINANGCRLMEIDDFASLRGQLWWNLWPETDADMVREAVGKANRGETVQFQALRPTATGKPQWWDVIVTRVPGESRGGHAATLICVSRDITERKEAEAALQQNAALLSRIVDQAPTGMYVVDAEFRLQQVNALAAPVFSTVHPLIGRNFSEVIQILWGPQVGSHIATVFRHTLETGERYISPPFMERRYDLGEEQAYEWETQRVTLADGRHGVVCYFHEITARQRAERALRESEERLHILTTAMPQLVWSCASSGECIFQASQWETLTGQPVADSLGFGWLEMVHDDDRARIAEEWQEAVKEGKRYQSEYRLHSRDGTYRWFLVRAEPSRNTSGTVMQWIGTSTDVDAAKRIEMELREAEGRVRERGRFVQSILNTAPATIYINDIVQRKRVYTSSNVATALGYSQAEMDEMGEDLLPQLIHADDQVGLQNHFRRVAGLADGQALDFEYRMRHKNGTWSWFLSRDTVYQRTEDGRVQEVLGAATDITHRKQAEEILRQREEQLRIITDSLPSLIAYVDRDERYRFVNAAYERMFGRLREDIIGRSMAELLGTSYAASKHYVMRALAGERVSFETPMASAGSEVTVLISHLPHITTDGSVVGFYALGTDISDRIHYENELRRSAFELEQRVAERTRELVASQGSLRALASQLTVAEQRERRRLASELHDYLSQLLVLGRLKLAQARRLALDAQPRGYIQEADEVLDKALTYARTLVAELSPPTLREFGLVAALNWLAEQMKRHELAVRIECAIKKVHVPEEHAVLLFQSIRELLINAAKHAGCADVLLSLEILDGRLVIRVIDSGKGFVPNLAVGGRQSGTDAAGFGLLAFRNAWRRSKERLRSTRRLAGEQQRL